MAVIPIVDNDSIILVKQYRKAVEKFLLEIPAGKLEINEEPRVTAIRELKEETGYTTDKMEYLMEFYTSPGFTNEKIYLFLATDLVKGEADPDDGEFLEVEKYDMDTLIKMIERGEITDSKTIIGINLAKKYLEENNR